MFWKKRKSDEVQEHNLIVMNDLLKKSFSNVKRDTANIFQWLQYLYKKNLEQGQTIKGMQMELSYMPKTREEIKKIIDSYYSFEGILSKLHELNIRVDDISKTRQQPQQIIVQKPASETVESGISAIEHRLEKLEQKKASIKEKIVKKITRNSKEYIKSVILSYIRKYERISALQLKEIVVDEQNFCSKSSFYRILDEIEILEDIGVIRQGKEKQYVSKTLKRI
jgi:hypothetical protein